MEYRIIGFTTEIRYMMNLLTMTSDLTIKNLKKEEQSWGRRSKRKENKPKLHNSSRN